MRLRPTGADPLLVDGTGPIFHDFDTLNALETRLKGDFAAGSTAIFKGDMPRHSLMWSENEAINRLAENASDMPDKPDGLDMIRRIQAHDWSERIKVGYVSDDFTTTARR